MPTLTVVGFKKDKFRASEVLNELVEMDYAWTIDLNDAIAAYRDYNGNLRIDANYRMTTSQDVALDGFFRSLIGLTLGAINAPVSAGGALDAKWWKEDLEIPDEFVKDVGALVQPGDSAIFALLRTADPIIVTAKFSDYGGVVQSTTLSPEQAKRMQDGSNGRSNFNIAGPSPHTRKEKQMATWTEKEKQIEPQLRALAKAMDEIDTQEAAAEAELDAAIKVTKADAQAKLRARQAKMNADLEARRTKLQQDMRALNDKINAAAALLDAETDKAIGRAKADLEAQQAQMRADREKLNAQLKANYTAEVKHIKKQIEQMRVLAQATGAKYSAKIDAELDALYKQAEEVDRQVANLIAESAASLNEKSAKVERAIADLKEGRAKAMADLTAASEKAEAEFKKPA